jgi:hypothetical protein
VIILIFSFVQFRFHSFVEWICVCLCIITRMGNFNCKLHHHNHSLALLTCRKCNFFLFRSTQLLIPSTDADFIKIYCKVVSNRFELNEATCWARQLRVKEKKLPSSWPNDTWRCVSSAHLPVCTFDRCVIFFYFALQQSNLF